MALNLTQMLNRLELLSLRERVMALVGAPLLLLLAAELLVFAPAGKEAAAAQKQAELQQTELKALSAVLAAQPVQAPLPAADQLIEQRSALQDQIDAAQVIVAGASRTVNWGTVVCATVAGSPGLMLTQLKTQPAELVFAPTMVNAATPAKPGTPPSPTAPPAPGAAMRGAVAPAEAGDSIYRHRAELTVNGNFSGLLGYLQTLQAAPGNLRWDKLQLRVATYPQASMLLSLHTLSNRSETPFN